MDSAMVSKIEKAKLYAEESEERIRFQEFRATVTGKHGTYTVTFNEGKWHCECPFFSARGVCSHTMAIDRILDFMLPSRSE